MSNSIVLYKQLENARLHKNNGGWMYCNNCNNTVGYLCYSTYDYFEFSFSCNCGEKGSIEIGNKENLNSNVESTVLLLKKGRLCCPIDESPLFSVEKNLKEYSYRVVCKNCSSYYEITK